MSFGLALFALTGVSVGHAETIIMTSVTAGGAGGNCTAQAKYNYDSGGSVTPSGPPCGGSVIPSTAGATAASLLATTTPGGSSASASFDLSTGAVRASIYGVPAIGGGDFNGTLRDGVTFNNTNPNSVLLGVTWNITGSLAPYPSQTGNQFDLSFQGVLGGVVTYTFHYDSANGTSVNNIQVNGYSNDTSSVNNQGVGASATAYYLLNPGLNPLTFQESIAMGGCCGSFDMGHTFQIGLILPAGVTYTSDSGAFLTAPSTPTPAPEPSTIAILGAGVAMLAVFGRKARRRQSSF